MLLSRRPFEQAICPERASVEVVWDVVLLVTTNKEINMKSVGMDIHHSFKKCPPSRQTYNADAVIASALYAG